MADVLLKGGPCDPRRVTMQVTADADAVYVRPMPFECHDVYVVTERMTEKDQTVSHATGEYLHTAGPRNQVDAYRKTMQKFGSGRAFKVKRERVQ